MATRTFFITAVMVVAGASLAFAQYGSAPNGYYPQGFNGDTFTGIVTATDDSTQTVTMEYAKGKKKETFTGRFNQPCTVPTNDGHQMIASDLPVGTDLTVYYERKTKKVNGNKEHENVIIGLTFNSLQGQAIPKSSKAMYPCTKGPAVFRAY
jgi:hypothetical protein